MREILRISCAILLLVYEKIGLQFAKGAEFIIIVVALRLQSSFPSIWQKIFPLETFLSCVKSYE